MPVQLSPATCAAPVLLGWLQMQLLWFLHQYTLRWLRTTTTVTGSLDAAMLIAIAIAMVILSLCMSSLEQGHQCMSSLLQSFAEAWHCMNLHARLRKVSHYNTVYGCRILPTAILAHISALQSEGSKKLQYDFTNHPGKDSGKKYITPGANGQVTDDAFVHTSTRIVVGCVQRTYRWDTYSHVS